MENTVNLKEEEGDIAGVMMQDACVSRSKEKSWAACSFHLGSQVPSELKTRLEAASKPGHDDGKHDFEQFVHREMHRYAGQDWEAWPRYMCCS
jgi:hypothetical protein